jgi:hypothetical protein
VIDKALEKNKVVRGNDSAQPKAREPEQPTHTDGQERPRGRQWASSIPQVTSEDIIDIGKGRYAHFRRDRRFAQVQVKFTAPEDVDPNPGRELTDPFREQGWIWREKEPGKPWTYQLDKSSKDDPTARGDSRDALHEQFLLIIQEYREKHGMPPTIGWQSLTAGDANDRNVGSHCLPIRSEVAQAAKINEKQKPPSPERETRGGGQRWRCSTPSPA